MLLVGIAASVAALAILALLSRGRGYGKLVGNEHALELARVACTLKEAALARADTPDADVTSRDDPRVVVSSAGAAIVYTIHAHPERCVHHCSVGIVGGPTPHAIGGPLLVFVGRVLGLDVERAEFRIGPTGVHHLQLALAPGEHAALASQSVAQIDDPKKWMRDAMSYRDRVKWQRAELEA